VHSAQAGPDARYVTTESVTQRTRLTFLLCSFQQDAEDAAAKACGGDRDGDGLVKSASDFSCQSYEMFVGNAPDRGTVEDLINKEKMSIKSDSVDSISGDPRRANGRVRKVSATPPIRNSEEEPIRMFCREQASLSLPGSPFNLRRGSKGSHQFTWRNGPRRLGAGDRKPLVLSTYLDAQEHLPYADDSAAVTPMSEDNGAIIVPVNPTLGETSSGGFLRAAISSGQQGRWPVNDLTRPLMWATY